MKFGTIKDYKQGVRVSGLHSGGDVSMMSHVEGD